MQDSSSSPPNLFAPSLNLNTKPYIEPPAAKKMRPAFKSAKYKYDGIYASRGHSDRDMAKAIGGQVGTLFNCPIPWICGSDIINPSAVLMSFILNMTGYPIPSVPGHTLLGKAGNHYFIRFGPMFNHLKKALKSPFPIGDVSPRDLAQKSGILAFADEWGQRKGNNDPIGEGYFDLWDDPLCLGQSASSSWGQVKVAFWELDNPRPIVI